ncbi:hypothetical protein V8017_00195 [Stenotrophomonas rhizophila]
MHHIRACPELPAKVKWNPSHSATMMDKETATIILSVAAFVVSCATLLVALSQMKIASAKSRLDLYNKRFNIYLAALDYYQAAWGKSDKALEKCKQDFIKSYRESQFLFKASDGVYQTLTAIKDAGASATGLADIIKQHEDDPNRAVTHQTMMADWRRSRMDSLQSFENSLMQLEKQLSAYIRFERASGWHPFK